MFDPIETQRDAERRSRPVARTGEISDGQLYRVQHHGRGSLHERVRREGTLPLDEVLRLGVLLAGALETAHRLDITRRDVEPANILFTDDGQPAPTDFGIAHPAGVRDRDGNDHGIAGIRCLEVLNGWSPSPASDVYRLGGSLFCALTGHAAFERGSCEQIVARFPG